MANKKKELSLEFSHLDKVYWPDDDYTKGDLIHYYEQIAPYILPYLKNRPVMLHRYPSGIGAQGFYQKNVSEFAEAWMETVKIEHEEHPVTYILVQNEETLLYLVNLGCIELHSFISSVPKLDHPDYIVFDLDPEGVTFSQVIDTAQTVHTVLNEAGLTSVCKTSGGRGLHVYVPLHRVCDYDQAIQIAKAISGQVHQELPELTSLELARKNRQHAIFIDIHRNSWAQTTIAPYCVRPRPGASVSTPLKWEEVKYGLDPADFNIKTVPKRLVKVGDLFKPVLGASNTVALKKLLGRVNP